MIAIVESSNAFGGLTLGEHEWEVILVRGKSMEFEDNFVHVVYALVAAAEPSVVWWYNVNGDIILTTKMWDKPIDDRGYVGAEKPTCKSETRTLTASEAPYEFYVGDVNTNIPGEYTCTVVVNNVGTRNILVTVAADGQSSPDQCVVIKNKSGSGSGDGTQVCTSGSHPAMFTSKGSGIEIHYPAKHVSTIKAFRVTFVLDSRIRKCKDIAGPLAATESVSEFYIGEANTNIPGEYTCTVVVNNVGTRNILVTVAADGQSSPDQCVVIKNKSGSGSGDGTQVCTSGSHPAMFTSKGSGIEIHYPAKHVSTIKAFRVTFVLDSRIRKCKDIAGPLAATESVSEFYIGEANTNIPGEYTCTVVVNNVGTRNILVTVAADGQSSPDQCVVIKNKSGSGSGDGTQVCTSGSHPAMFTSKGSGIEIHYPAKHVWAIISFRVIYSLERQTPSVSTCGDGADFLTAKQEPQEFYIGSKGKTIPLTFACTVKIQSKSGGNITVKAVEDGEAQRGKCVVVKHTRTSEIIYSLCASDEINFISIPSPIEVSFLEPIVPDLRAFKIQYSLESENTAIA
ncbi:unnamed protein product [Echinostoma caproni]|uniref:Ig-like domain-containing protein n=1 Tax=Echinostoma caproni TaxID=27848 RepID=A0A183ADG6_9TREM|nr:unnamed protein product [Echinostoma caproni]